jgi:hypothetical protein
MSDTVIPGAIAKQRRLVLRYREIDAEVQKCLSKQNAKGDYEVSYPVCMVLFCRERNVSVITASLGPTMFTGIDNLSENTFPFLYVDRKQRATILHRPDTTPELTRFELAREFAHTVLHLPAGERDYFVTREDVPEECMREAAEFANSLLIPAAGILSMLQDGYDQEEIATSYGVPVHEVHRRIEKLEKTSSGHAQDREIFPRHLNGA